MVDCPYCRKSVYSQSNECPECGKRLPGQEGSGSAGKRKLPRIVGEEANKPINQPPRNNAQYQQPVYQPEQRQQQYQQPIYRPEQRQKQPAFQQQYVQPQEGLSEKKSLKPIILIVIGGIMAMIFAVAVFRISAMGFTAYVDIGFLEDNMVYGWLIPISGMLGILFGIFGQIKQDRKMSMIVIILGILALILPLILAAHMSSEGELSIGEVFYVSESQTGFGFSNVYIGGILAMVGGVILIIGGILLLKKIGKTEKQVKVRYPRDY